LISFYSLLRHNRNYRNVWIAQVVSEIGGMFNTIAVLSLALHVTGSNAAVGGVMIARTIAALASAPIAGVMLDRLDRKRVMVASDLVQAVFAAALLLTTTSAPALAADAAPTARQMELAKRLFSDMQMDRVMRAMMAQMAPAGPARTAARTNRAPPS